MTHRTDLTFSDTGHKRIRSCQKPGSPENCTSRITPGTLVVPGEMNLPTSALCLPYSRRAGPVATADGTPEAGEAGPSSEPLEGGAVILHEGTDPAQECRVVDGGAHR